MKPIERLWDTCRDHTTTVQSIHLSAIQMSTHMSTHLLQRFSTSMSIHVSIHRYFECLVSPVARGLTLELHASPFSRVAGGTWIKCTPLCTCLDTCRYTCPYTYLCNVHTQPCRPGARRSNCSRAVCCRIVYCQCTPATVNLATVNPATAR